MTMLADDEGKECTVFCTNMLAEVCLGEYMLQVLQLLFHLQKENSCFVSEILCFFASPTPKRHVPSLKSGCRFPR